MAALPLRFDGRVALITGAGGGLGKAYAKLFSERGASVIVNDLGGDPHGSNEGSQRPADIVVDEIIRAGGKAVANYDSVEDAEKVINSAVNSFGRLDILINNAGILRDRSIMKCSNLDWDLVHRVHLRGAFLLSRAAWPIMKKQGYGRIVMTASNAGVFGNFGQSNYAAAKMGLIGLSNTLSLEGAKYNIHCNTIVPTAGSRLTQSVMPPDLVEALKPEYVAPLVVYLCHGDCEASGSVFEAAAGWAGQLRWERTKGVVLRSKSEQMTPEAVRDNWSAVTDFTDSTHPTTIQESTASLVSVLQEIAGHQINSNENTASKGLSAAIGFQLSETTFTYTSRDAILYALGVGVTTRSPRFLNFLFEGSEHFSVLPTFAVIPAQESMFGQLLSGAVPGLDSINPANILHGEQYTEVFKPFPADTTVTSKATVVDVLDKGSGALIIANVETFDSNGDKLAFNQFTIFAVGSGNFGGKRRSNAAINTVPIPQGNPDFVLTSKTTIDQAALYRLTGDKNPLHIDPGFAALGGFDKPVLHGLCTLGYAVRDILDCAVSSDVSKIKSVKVRMAKPVIPGQTLVTECWLANKRIHFQTKVAETGVVCLSNGYVDLTETAIVSKPKM